GAARLVIGAPLEVLPPVVALRDGIEVLSGGEAAGAGRDAAVDAEPRRGARCDLHEAVRAVAARSHRLRVVHGGGLVGPARLGLMARIVELRAIGAAGLRSVIGVVQVPRLREAVSRTLLVEDRGP